MTDSTAYAEQLTASPVPEHGMKHEANSRDRDSGVFLSDSEDTASVASSSRPTSIVLKDTSSFTSTSTPTRGDSTARRLRRPAELNLSSSNMDPAKPKSELELRYDMIRNSQTKSKATLKSPTQLLKDRLNLSPKKSKEEKIRIFTPPRPMLNGCILPAPQSQLAPFQGSSVRARTDKEGRPAWWCKFDKLVVFDGIEEEEGSEVKVRTRTSKGLSIARRRGDVETIVIPLDCSHCQQMLNRTEWKYDVQVCKRSVCWDCKQRCLWETEQEKNRSIGASEIENDANRTRADSVLQDDQLREEELCEKAGIETGERSPIAVVGIEERLETVDGA